MNCRVCGIDGAKYYPKKRLTMCSRCAAETADKISRGEFDPQYWGENYRDVPVGVRRDFYSDYLHGRSSFAAYKRDTTSDAA